MKTVPTKIEKAEFWINNGQHVVWLRSETRTGWTVIVYLHGEQSKQFRTLGNLPSIENANYFAKKALI